MKIALVGYGKMGKEIEQILIARGHTISLIIDVNNTADLDADHLRGIDVAIEFTTPQTAYGNIVKCIDAARRHGSTNCPKSNNSAKRNRALFSMPRITASA